MVVDAARPNNGTRTAGKALAPNTDVPHSPQKGMRHGKKCRPAHRECYGERRRLPDENLADLSLLAFDLHEIYSGLGDGEAAAAGRTAGHQTAGR